MIDDHQKRVANPNNGLLASSSDDESMELGREIAVLTATGHLNGLHQYLLRALTQFEPDEVTWSGSSRHQSTVSKTRSKAACWWLSSLQDLATLSLSLFIRSGAPAATDMN